MAQTPLSLLFLVLNFIGILLVGALVVVYISHRGARSVLMQLCILTILHNIVALPLLLVYGEDHVNNAPADLCIAQAFLIHYLKLAASVSAVCMSLTLFLIVVTLKHDAEKRYYKVFLASSLGIPLILTSISFALWHNRPNMAATPHAFYCRTEDDAIQFYTMRVPLMLTLLVAMFCIARSMYEVYKRHKKVTKYGSTPEGGVHNSLVLRLFVYTAAFCLITLMGNLKQIVGFLNGSSEPDMKPGMTEWATVAATFGLFLLFGTTREIAQTLLPCLHIRPISRAKSTTTSTRSFNFSQTRSTTNTIRTMWDDDIQLERPVRATLSPTWSLDSPTRIPPSPTTQGLMSPTRWPGSPTRWSGSPTRWSGSPTRWPSSPLRGPDSPMRGSGSSQKLTVDTRTLGVRRLASEGNSPASSMSDRSAVSDHPLMHHYDGRHWDGAASEDSAAESTTTTTNMV